MEKSHQRTMMEMRRTHRQELDRVVQEKDQLLKEEADATQAGFTRDIVSYVSVSVLLSRPHTNTRMHGRVANSVTTRCLAVTGGGSVLSAAD